MELLVSGVEVPKLGTVKDRILRDYLLKRASKEVSKNKALIMGLMGIMSSAPNGKAAIDMVAGHWSNYVNQELYLESIIEERETDLRSEYQRWRLVRPEVQLKKNEEGKMAMAISISSLTPKIQE